MKKTCPLLNVECRRERCAFYSEKYEECSILLLAEVEANWQQWSGLLSAYKNV